LLVSDDGGATFVVQGLLDGGEGRLDVAARRAFAVRSDERDVGVLTTTPLVQTTATVVTPLGAPTAQLRLDVDGFGRAFVARAGDAGVEIGTPAEGVRGIVVGATLPATTGRVVLAALHDGVAAVTALETAGGIVVAVPVLEAAAAQLVPLEMAPLAACGGCDAVAAGVIERSNDTVDLVSGSTGSSEEGAPVLPPFTYSVSTTVTSAAAGLLSTAAGSAFLRSAAAWAFDDRELAVTFAIEDAYAGSRSSARSGCGTGVFAVEAVHRGESALGWRLGAATCVDLQRLAPVQAVQPGIDVGFGYDVRWRVGRRWPVEASSADVVGEFVVRTRTGLVVDTLSTDLERCTPTGAVAPVGVRLPPGDYWLEADLSVNTAYDAETCGVLDDRILAAVVGVRAVPDGGRFPAGSGPLHAVALAEPQSESSVGYMLQRSMPDDLLGVLCSEADGVDTVSDVTLRP